MGGVCRHSQAHTPICGVGLHPGTGRCALHVVILSSSLFIAVCDLFLQAVFQDHSAYSIMGITVYIDLTCLFHWVGGKVVFTSQIFQDIPLDLCAHQSFHLILGAL